MMIEKLAPRAARSRIRVWARVRGGLLVGVVLAACTGCQTFSLTEEDFEKQQRGELVDRETGAITGAAGTVGYLGAIAGEAVSAAVKK